MLRYLMICEARAVEAVGDAKAVSALNPSQHGSLNPSATLRYTHAHDSLETCKDARISDIRKIKGRAK
jgi:hypothetical protein